MKPTYVTFEQAKKLKEKGFDEVCLNAYNSHGMEARNGWCEYIYDQGLEIFNSNLKPKDVSAPEQWQVIEWLRVNHKIDITHCWDNREGEAINGYSFEISYPKKDFVKGKSNYWEEFGLYLDWSEHNGSYRFKSPQEAYSAAFDYVLENLMI